MKRTADVIVVGGGIIGCSTAYHLARMGMTDVILLERDQVGAGASSQSAAMLSLQFCQDELTVQMARYCYDRYMAFEDELGVSTDFRPTGWMYVATEASAGQLKQQVAMLQEAGVSSELLQPGDVSRLFPELNTEDIVLGSWGAEDGPFDPHMIMWGYLRQARELGVAVHEGRTVEGLLLKNGAVSGVHTDDGLFHSRAVVNAAGAWAGEIAGWAGLTLPLQNATRSIVVTNPIAGIPDDRPFVEDLEKEWYVRPEGEGVLMGMGQRPVTDLDVGLDEAQVEAIIDTAMHRLPLLQNASILTAWTAVRPMTHDGLPIVGVDEAAPGLLHNCGWGGIGIIMAPLAGQLAAEIITGGQAQTMDIEPLAPDRQLQRDERG
ncbi:MAG TPA: FAD-binding oxidoreductase [Candidatus Sulfomarinibacteraceae bacterium]|nr:FAD-binding oxidoreductase [Candidatus Sulfomarinibacteraceae bacterium]